MSAKADNQAKTADIANSPQKMPNNHMNDLNRKVNLLKEELCMVNSKLNEFTNELNDFSSRNLSSNQNGGLSQFSTTDMTHRMYERSSDPNILPERIYIKRDSLLTELFRITHIRTIRHIFISIMIIFALQVCVNDLAEKGTIDLNFNLIRWAFGKASIVFYTWLYMKFFTTCLVYCSFHYWSKSRVDFLVQLSKKNDDLKTKDLRLNVYDLCWLLSFVVYLIGFIVVPAIVVYVNQLPPASSMIILSEQLRLLMKTYAFVRSNIPRALENGSYYVQNGGIIEHDSDPIEYETSSNEEFDLCDDKKRILCPDFSKYLYFLFAPTLVYRDYYPRTSRVNWNVVASNFAQVIGSLFYVNYIFVRFCIPVFQDFNKEHVTLQSFVRSILNCHLSGSLLLLIGFFSFLHCWLNAFAEMLCFGDRMFYKDWWNSTNFQNYYRTWNCVVHDFLYTYIYKDTYYLVGKRYKIISQFTIFFISAVFHEYVLTFALGFFYPVLFVMFGAIGFLCMFLKPQNNSNFWNFVLWIGLQIGLGGLMCLYSIEWFARQNCKQAFESDMYDYLIPRSFTCGMGDTSNKTNINNPFYVSESIRSDL